MVEVTHQVFIKQPPDVVFAAATDASQWPEWVSFLSEVKHVPPTGLKQDARIDLISKLLGATIVHDATVTEYDAPHQIAYRSTRPFEAIMSWTFTPVEEGTRIDVRVDGDPGNLMNSAGAMIGAVIQKLMTDEFNRLKERLEGKQD